MAATARLTFPQTLRLRRPAEFRTVQAQGRRLGNGFFGMTSHANHLGRARLGLAVAVRTAGGGVARNRLRRLIRESFRLHQHEFPAVDLVVSIRAAAAAASAAELRESLGILWKRVRPDVR